MTNENDKSCLLCASRVAWTTLCVRERVPWWLFVCTGAWLRACVYGVWGGVRMRVWACKHKGPVRAGYMLAAGFALLRACPEWLATADIVTSAVVL